MKRILFCLVFAALLHADRKDDNITALRDELKADHEKMVKLSASDTAQRAAIRRDIDRLSTKLSEIDKALAGGTRGVRIEAKTDANLQRSKQIEAILQRIQGMLNAQTDAQNTKLVKAVEIALGIVLMIACLLTGVILSVIFKVMDERKKQRQIDADIDSARLQRENDDQ